MFSNFITIGLQRTAVDRSNVKEKQHYDDRRSANSQTQSASQNDCSEYYTNDMMDSPSTGGTENAEFTSSSSATMTRPVPVRSHQQKVEHDQSRIWRSAIDPKTGRTYYYDVLTRETQWRKV